MTHKQGKYRGLLRRIDWRVYRNRLILFFMCFVFFVILIMDYKPKIDLVEVSGHLMARPKISRYGGDVQKTIIEIRLLESATRFRIDGTCGYKSADIDQIERLREGDYVYLSVNSKKSFFSFSFDEGVYALRDDQVQYLNLTNYDECETNFGLALIILCISIMTIIIFSILRDQKYLPMFGD